MAGDTRKIRFMRVDFSDLTFGCDNDGVLMESSRLGTVDEIRDALRPYYGILVEMYESEMVVESDDYRSGSDTYGYETLEGIQWSLRYISDRWRTCFRVRWLIDLINPEYKLWDGQLKS